MTMGIMTICIFTSVLIVMQVVKLSVPHLGIVSGQKQMGHCITAVQNVPKLSIDNDCQFIALASYIGTA